MLYTVMPLERVYANPRSEEEKQWREKHNLKEDSEEEYQEINLQNGRVIAHRSGKNYVVERINSTDMKDYLNEDYSPGKEIKRPE
jgi:hypothetical protein